MMAQPRAPQGVPGGGQFRSRERPEVHLPTALNPHPEADRWDEATYRDLAKAAAAGSAAELERMMGHPNPYVRAEVASNLYLSPDQAWRLADDQDWCVRWQIARREVDGIADKLSDDDDEIIRAECLADPNLDPSARRRLEADPEVSTVIRRLAGASQ